MNFIKILTVGTAGKSRGVLDKCLYREAPPRGPTPYPVYTIFHEKGTPLYTLVQMVLLSHSLFRTLHPF